MAYELPEGLVATQLGLATLAIAAVLLLRFLHLREPKWLISVQPGWRWRYLIACLLVAILALNLVQWLSFTVEGWPFQQIQTDWVYFMWGILLTSPLQAAAEEIFFRGYLLQAFGSLAGKAWVGVVGTALLFAFLHGTQNPALFANRLAFGLIAGFLVIKTGGLEAGIAAHIVNNVFAFGYALFTGGVAATKTVDEISWGQAAFDIAGFALFALIAWRVAGAMRVARKTP